MLFHFRILRILLLLQPEKRIEFVENIGSSQLQLFQLVRCTAISDNQHSVHPLCSSTHLTVHPRLSVQFNILRAILRTLPLQRSDVVFRAHKLDHVKTTEVVATMSY